MSWLERLARWCRRKPALATAGGLAIFALIVGSITSTVFGIHASNTAESLREEQKHTKAALSDAKNQRAAAEIRLAELLQDQGLALGLKEDNYAQALLFF